MEPVSFFLMLRRVRSACPWETNKKSTSDMPFRLSEVLFMRV